MQSSTKISSMWDSSIAAAEKLSSALGKPLAIVLATASLSHAEPPVTGGAQPETPSAEVIKSNSLGAAIDHGVEVLIGTATVSAEDRVQTIKNLAAANNTDESYFVQCVFSKIRTPTVEQTRPSDSVTALTQSLHAVVALKAQYGAALDGEKNDSIEDVLKHKLKEMPARGEGALIRVAKDQLEDFFKPNFDPVKFAVAVKGAADQFDVNYKTAGIVVATEYGRTYDIINGKQDDAERAAWKARQLSMIREIDERMGDVSYKDKESGDIRTYSTGFVRFRKSSESNPRALIIDSYNEAFQPVMARCDPAEIKSFIQANNLSVNEVNTLFENFAASLNAVSAMRKSDFKKLKLDPKKFTKFAADFTHVEEVLGKVPEYQKGLAKIRLAVNTLVEQKR